jgi:competence ComEA-like helix-hairpin-helix protein
MDAPLTLLVTANPPGPAEPLTVSVSPVASSPACSAAPWLGSTAVATTWPRSAQLTTAVLLAFSVGLLAWNLLQTSRWGTRPTELQPRSLGYRIDLNAAPHAELLQLPGVGENLARRIESQRPYSKVTDLLQVQGVGPSLLERLRPWVRVSQAVTAEEEFQEPPAKPARSGSKANSATGKEAAVATIRGGKEASLTQPIDINRATAEELQRLPGIGPKLSERILAEREKSPFKSVADLRRVSGIGPKVFERLRPYITVGNPTEKTAPADKARNI